MIWHQTLTVIIQNFTAGVNVTDNGYYDPGVGAGGRGYSVESPSCSISLSSDQNSSSLTPPSPLLTVPRWEVVGPIPASGQKTIKYNEL